MANRLLRNLILILVLASICRPLPAQDTIKPLPADTAKAPALKKDTARLAAQQDTTGKPVRLKPYHSPQKAAFYSAILPGLGQIYNREYWKLPLVYGAVGIPAGFFFFNFDKYKTYRDAYRARVDGNPETHDQFEGLYTDPQALKTLRDAYRQYVDYSVLIFILGYSLNIVDAVVFAHLRGFDMSDDLSLRVTPTIIDNRALGLSLRIGIGNGKRSRARQGWAWGK